MEVDMAHFKRKRPKSRRAGCLLCKPHKANEMKDSIHALRPRDRRDKDRLDAQMADLETGAASHAARLVKESA